jgi:D-alanyl-lipoteichoic acid acyltransferase DltB (MBOAT superfamily)
VLFTEPTFLFLFLPVLLALYFAPATARRLLPGRARPAPGRAPLAAGRTRSVAGRASSPPTVHGQYANWLLLVASVIFYAKGGGAFTWLMLASIAFNYWMAIATHCAAGPSATKVPAYSSFLAEREGAFLEIQVLRRQTELSIPKFGNRLLVRPRPVVEHD